MSTIVPTTVPSLEIRHLSGMDRDRSSTRQGIVFIFTFLCSNAANKAVYNPKVAARSVTSPWFRQASTIGERIPFNVAKTSIIALMNTLRKSTIGSHFV